MAMTMEERSRKHFIEYNEKFFEGKLADIKLEWSDRMRISAGTFYPSKKSKNLGKITLNRKLLKTRSDTEVLETLLHEMTHAYLTQIHGGAIKPHGKEFCEKIFEINVALRIDITAKHDFITWWRCNGICRTKADHFYGYVSGVDEQQVFGKNPQAVENHAKYCGGTFEIDEKPNSELLSEMRYLKRKRNSKKKVGVVQGCENAVDQSLIRHDAPPENAPKRARVMHYSTDSGEE